MKVGSGWYALLALLVVYGYWLSTQLKSRRPLALRAAAARSAPPSLKAVIELGRIERPMRGAPLDAVEVFAEPPPLVRGIALDFGALGEMRLFLRPEWTADSSTFAEAVAGAAAAGAQESSIYRLEPGFLIQGALSAKGVRGGGPKPKAIKMMERGEVGWAGGGGGPDFFIYLGDGPASWLGSPHEGTIWAEVADEASLAVAANVSHLPVPTPKPGEMHLLARKLPIGVRPWGPEHAQLAELAISGGAILKVKGASVDHAAADCEAGCNALAHTELHGSPVVWGANHRTPTAAACCAACAAHRARAQGPAGGKQGQPTKGCNVWVYCASAALCGSQHQECWLKHHHDVWAAPQISVGTSPRWTTGTAASAPANHSSGAGLRPPRRDDADLVLRVQRGRAQPEAGAAGVLSLHLRMRAAGASRARARLEALLAQPAPCRGCALTFASSAPADWGSDQQADGQGPAQRWPAGRALVRGTLGAAAAPSSHEAALGAEFPQAPVRRGTVGWWPTAGGSATASGPSFFVALADMPQLGTSAVTWADVALEDMPALEQLAAEVEAGTLQLPLALRVERMPRINPGVAL